MSLDMNDVAPEAITITSLAPDHPRERQSRPWIVPGFALKGNLTMIHGAPGSTKSLFGLHLGVAVATGVDWGPLKVSEPGPVLIVNREDDLAEMDLRLWAISHGQDIQPGSPLFRVDVSDASVVAAVQRPDRQVVLQPTRFRDQLCEEIKRHGAKLVILDPFIELSSGADENDNDAQNEVVEALRRIAVETDCAVVIVHHENKTGSGAYAARGASAILGRVRVAIRVEFAGENDVAEGADPSDFRKITSTKQNYAKTGSRTLFEVKAEHDEAQSGEWCPRLVPSAIRLLPVDGELINRLDGCRATRGSPDLKELAEALEVSLSDLKAAAARLIEEGYLEIGKRYSEAREREVDHYLKTEKTWVDPIPL